MQAIVEDCLEILHQRCTLDIMNKLNRLSKSSVCAEFWWTYISEKKDLSNQRWVKIKCFAKVMFAWRRPAHIFAWLQISLSQQWSNHSILKWYDDDGQHAMIMKWDESCFAVLVLQAPSVYIVTYYFFIHKTGAMIILFHHHDEVEKLVPSWSSHNRFESEKQAVLPDQRLLTGEDKKQC